MKIKLLACVAFMAIMPSCAKEDEILPKNEVPSNELSATKRPGMMSYSRPLQSTNFNNSWPLAKSVKPVKSLTDNGNESLSGGESLLINSKLIAQDHNYRPGL